MGTINIFFLFFIFSKILNPTQIFIKNNYSENRLQKPPLTKVKLTNKHNRPSFILQNTKFDNLYSFVEQLKSSNLSIPKLLQLITYKIYSLTNQEESECVNIFDSINKKNFKQILKYKDQINLINESGHTPIIYALLQGDDLFDVIYTLILLEAPINQEDANGNHPLMIAILKQLPLSLKALLQFDLNANKLYKNPNLSIGFASNYKTPLALANDMINLTQRNTQSLFIKRELIISGAKD